MLQKYLSLVSFPNAEYVIAGLLEGFPITGDIPVPSYAPPAAIRFPSVSAHDLRAKAPAWCLATTGVATTGARRTWARAERRVVVGTFVETARTAEADMEAWSFVCAVGNGNNASLLA